MKLVFEGAPQCDAMRRLLWLHRDQRHQEERQARFMAMTLGGGGQCSKWIVHEGHAGGLSPLFASVAEYRRCYRP